MADDFDLTKKMDALIRQTRQNGKHFERMLAHQIWQGLGEDKVVTFPYQNETIQFHVPDGWLDAVQRIIMTNRTFYEAALLEQIRAIIPPGATFVDAGANVGNHTVYFLRLCKAAKVHAFEAMPHMQAVLQRNADLNGPDRVQVHPYALGAAEGTAGVAIFNAANLGATTLDADSDGAIPVRAMDAFELQDVAFIKIDVEGMQDAVLNGARDTIARCQPVMVIEAFERGDERAQTTALLGDMGYRVDQVIGHNILAVPA